MIFLSAIGSDPDQYYLLRKETSYGQVNRTIKLPPGENLWEISQQYGIQVKKLKKYNRITSDRELYCRYDVVVNGDKPKDADKTAAPAEVVQVDNLRTFCMGC